MPAATPNIPALVDQLQRVAVGGVGYSPSMSGDSFLPRGASQAGSMLLGQRPPERSTALESLVAAGATAVPHLIEHLNDRRPTKLALRYKDSFISILLSQEYDLNRRVAKVSRFPIPERNETAITEYTVTVGDLCFVALGQIVNRSFNAVRYQPSGLVMVNSPTSTEALRKRIVDEWGGLTAAQHRERLIRDFREPDHEGRRSGACLRLGYYYPEVLEPLVLKQLAAPRYDVFLVEALAREKLYTARDAATRKRLFDAFVARYGAVAREGILRQLFDDLYTHKAAARACLVELFGYPKEVTEEDQPILVPLDNADQARFIGTLAFYKTPKIGDAVRRLFRRTDDDYLATACAKYLGGADADAEIRRYVRTHRVGANADRRKSLEELEACLGWTPLHWAAASYDDSHVVELIQRGAEIDARAADGRTPLHVATDRGSFGMIRLLIQRKANVNARDRRGRTPIALGIRHADTVEMLLAAGAEPSDIFVAAFAGRAELVKRFLARDRALVRARTDEGETPLHIAAEQGQVQVAKVLLSHGADVNASDPRNQFTPLHLAAMRKRPAVVALLLAHGANRNAESWDSKTPLTYAIETKDAATIQLLEKR